MARKSNKEVVGTKVPTIFCFWRIVSIWKSFARPKKDFEIRAIPRRPGYNDITVDG